ncbi:hypothetical protein PENTCL1PPCAC_5359 [Pristionchus entomophagus]|uniref:BTB domain-containing protein n=1 Tax=Pristionchus entomophagus TaxID=358040 RepID=A0AAV5SSL3_9BILA|nr:hypothetical protein PENTCL1PPCAC_5359 [Pristionchus entomophagus]
MQKSDRATSFCQSTSFSQLNISQNDGYSKLAIGCREAFLRAEFDPSEINVSSLYDVLDPNSRLALSVNRWNESSTNLHVSADITIRVEEIIQRLDLSISRSMTSSDEWSIRLDSFLDLFPNHTLYICAVFICKVNVSALSLQLEKLFTPQSNTANYPRSKTNGEEWPFPILTCSIDVISSENHKVYMASRELLCLHSPFFTATFYRNLQEKEVEQCAIHSIEGETFDICTVFGGLLSAMHGNFSPMMCPLILADRYCMDLVKRGLENFMLAADLKPLLFSTTIEWMRAADVTGSEALLDRLVERMGANPSNLRKCFKQLNEIVSAPTRVKIFEKLYSFVETDSEVEQLYAGFDFGSERKIKKALRSLPQ